MNPLKLISQFLAMTQEQHDAVIKFCIALTFCCTVIIMVGVSLYSVVFVEQPQMMAPEQQISAAGAVPTAPSQAPPSPVGATPAAGQAPMNIDEILAAIGGAA